jgi:hypothetical protein
MTISKSHISYAVLFSLIWVAGLGIAQEAHGQSAGNQPPTLGLPGDRELNRDANIQAYVDLLRSNVREQKVQVISQIMAFSPSEAATFWPVYTEYDSELTELSDRRVELIKEYAENYGVLTDQKTDELVAGFFDLRVERTTLLRKYYNLLKGIMGTIPAARFVQVESQLVNLIDLEIASQLPAVE